MPVVNLSSKNVFSSGLVKLGLIALLGMTVVTSKGCLERYSQHRQEKAKIENLRKIVSEGKLEEANEIISVYSTNQAVKKVDLELISLDVKKLAKQKQITLLQEAIKAEDYETSKSLLEECASNGVLDKNALINYQRQFNSIFPENQNSADGLFYSLIRMSESQDLVSNSLIERGIKRWLELDTNKEGHDLRLEQLRENISNYLARTANVEPLSQSRASINQEVVYYRLDKADFNPIYFSERFQNVPIDSIGKIIAYDKEYEQYYVKFEDANFRWSCVWKGDKTEGRTDTNVAAFKLSELGTKKTNPNPGYERIRRLLEK